MPIPLYLAMTGAEFFHCQSLPPKIGWMACHFSPYSTGLSNRPEQLPAGSLLILNDRTPVCGHDPERIAAEMAEMARESHCAGILLDLQIPGERRTEEIVEAVCKAAPCPVGISPHYWKEELECAVFLEPPALHTPLSEHLAAWRGQPIWMEAAVEAAEYIITERGCRREPAAVSEALPHFDRDAFCQYSIRQEAACVCFTLQRHRQELSAMMAAADGVSLFVGLYQQLK